MILLAMERSVDYLKSEMEKRGWKQSDLSKYSGLDSGLINNYVSGRRNIGISSAVAIAKAFKVAPEIVLRKVGLLPDVPDTTTAEEQLLYMFRQLSKYDQEAILDFVEFKVNK
mgnify:CR=1 FL=1